MLHYPNMLLISGDGRNSGKTKFACAVIKLFRDKGAVAVKICAHMHDSTPGLVEVFKNERFVIFNETESGSSKDTSRMLSAGSKETYLIDKGKDSIREAVSTLMNLIEDNSPVIIESTGLAGLVRPGLSVFMKSDTKNDRKETGGLADQVDLILSSSNYKQSAGQIRFEKGKWQITL